MKEVRQEPMNGSFETNSDQNNHRLRIRPKPRKIGWIERMTFKHLYGEELPLWVPHPPEEQPSLAVQPGEAVYTVYLECPIYHFAQCQVVASSPEEAAAIALEENQLVDHDWYPGDQWSAIKHQASVQSVEDENENVVLEESDCTPSDWRSFQDVDGLVSKIRTMTPQALLELQKRVQQFQEQSGGGNRRAPEGRVLIDADRYTDSDIETDLGDDGANR